MLQRAWLGPELEIEKRRQELEQKKQTMIEKLGKSERQKNTRQVASVAAFNSDGKILFGLRGDVKRWCLPGGHLEPHEAPAKAAVRELLEETGLKAKSLERLGSAIVGKNGNVQVHCYRADVTGSPSADKDPDAEFIEFRWVNPDDIPEEILVNLYNKQDATLQLLEAQLKTLELSKASLAEIIARTKAVEHHIRRLASSGATEHVFPHPAGGSVLVARDPSKPGGWRATRIDAAGEPLGHVEALDVHQAIKHAHSYGADVMAVQQPFKKSDEDDEEEPDDGSQEGFDKAVRTPRHWYHWGSSHSSSQNITHYAAKQMGIPGYEYGHDFPLHQKIAHEMLTTIAHPANRSPEPLYHGFQNVKKIDWQPGAVIRLPLTATSGDTDTHSYGVKGNSEYQEGEPTMFEFPAGTPMAGYSAWDAPTAKEFGHRWSEAITAGEFKVGGVRQFQSPFNQHTDYIDDRGYRAQTVAQPMVKVVSLVPHRIFDPQKGWIDYQHQAPVKKFEQDLGQWLAKATQPSDFRKIVEATTAEGPRYVDHRSQMQAHPPELNPVVEHYQNEVAGGDQPMRPRGRFAGGGITRKVVFHTEARPQGDLFVPSRRGMTADFMVKPYHEGVVKRVKAWQKYPIQGWAEMAHQALYHAAGMGHLHQKVHVAEHEMQHKTGQKSIEPALVVTMEKGLTPAYKLARGDRLIDPQVEHDTAKIALMDFLTNNLDRHCGNLLFNSEQQQPPTDETLPTWVRNHGMHKIHGVMAIDHSRSFQYVNTPQGLDWRRRYGSKAPMKGDSPRGYFFGTPSHRPATSLILHRPADEQERRDFLESHAKPLFDWWREASPKVREAFDQQVAHIKDSEARDHVRRNFHERLKFLDERARLGIENYGTAWYDDDVPAYRPNEKTDEEQEAERTAAARAQWQKEAAARGVQP